MFAGSLVCWPASAALDVEGFFLSGGVLGIRDGLQGHEMAKDVMIAVMTTDGFQLMTGCVCLVDERTGPGNDGMCYAICNDGQRECMCFIIDERTFAHEDTTKI